MMLESIELVLARSRSGSSVKQSSTSATTRVITINSIHSTSQPQSQSSRQDQGHGQHENDEEASISVVDSGNVDNDVTIINDTTFSFWACLERWWHIVAISAVITGLVVLWPTFGLGIKNQQVQENAYIEDCEPGAGVERGLLRLRHEERKLQQQPSCSVCGDGMKVGNPDSSVSFPGQAGQIPCGVLQDMGTLGLIPPPQCAVLPQLISTVCECEPTTPPTTTVSPTTTTEATKPASGKSGKSMSVSSKAAKAKSEIIKCNTTKSSKVNRK